MEHVANRAGVRGDRGMARFGDGAEEGAMASDIEFVQQRLRAARNFIENGEAVIMAVNRIVDRINVLEGTILLERRKQSTSMKFGRTVEQWWEEALVLQDQIDVLKAGLNDILANTEPHTSAHMIAAELLSEGDDD